MKVEISKYDVLKKTQIKDSYEGKILTRSLSSRLLSSSKLTPFLLRIEDIIYNWYDSVRTIKRSINYRVDKNDKSIDA